MKKKTELKLVTGDRIECSPYVANKIAAITQRIQHLSTPKSIEAEIAALQREGSDIVQTVVETLGKPAGNWTTQIVGGKVYIVQVPAPAPAAPPAPEPKKE